MIQTTSAKTTVPPHAGKRMDNRGQERPGGSKGVRFFIEDEDEFGLEDMLQALCFRDAGAAWVPSKPWEHGVASKWTHDPSQLSAATQKHLALLSSRADNPND